jgi:hypothetical protein
MAPSLQKAKRWNKSPYVTVHEATKSNKYALCCKTQHPSLQGVASLAYPLLQNVALRFPSQRKGLKYPTPNAQNIRPPRYKSTAKNWRSSLPKAASSTPSPLAKTLSLQKVASLPTKSSIPSLQNMVPRCKKVRKFSRRAARYGCARILHQIPKSCLIPMTAVTVLAHLSQGPLSQERGNGESKKNNIRVFCY